MEIHVVFGNSSSPMAWGCDRHMVETERQRRLGPETESRTCPVGGCFGWLFRSLTDSPRSDPRVCQSVYGQHPDESCAYIGWKGILTNLSQKVHHFLTICEVTFATVLTFDTWEIFFSCRVHRWPTTHTWNAAARSVPPHNVADWDSTWRIASARMAIPPVAAVDGG